MAALRAGSWRRFLRAFGWRSGASWTPAAAPLHARHQTAPVHIGGYAVLRTLAHGAIGELHLVSEADSDRPLALKTVRFHGSDLSRERFLRESDVAVRLKHKGIVTTYAAGTEGQGEAELGWIAMEWIPGRDLGRYVAPQRLLPEALALELVARLADALAHAHAQGVIHRDLKPANVLVDLARGVVKITDFGCAHLSDAERSRSGLMAGSPAYMAPEQLQGAPLDGRCDLYALGVILWQLLTGRLPFSSASLGDLLAQIATQPAPRLADVRPDLPLLLSDIIARMLEKQPAMRQADASRVARELRLAASLFLANEGGANRPGGGHND